MIPQSQISKLSNRLLKEQGGRRIPENILERDYCIAWFLVGLSRQPLRNKLAFKGGTALRRCHFSDYRFSEDLDFTLLQSLSFEELKHELEPVYEEVKQPRILLFDFPALIQLLIKIAIHFISCMKDLCLLLLLLKKLKWI